MPSPRRDSTSPAQRITMPTGLYTWGLLAFQIHRLEELFDEPLQVQCARHGWEQAYP